MTAATRDLTPHAAKAALDAAGANTSPTASQDA